MQVHYTVEHKPDLNRSRSAYIKMFSALGKIILTNFLSGANEKACLEEDLFVIPKFICSYILWPSTLKEHPERDGWCSPWYRNHCQYFLSSLFVCLFVVLFCFCSGLVFWGRGLGCFQFCFVVLVVVVVFKKNSDF